MCPYKTKQDQNRTGNGIPNRIKLISNLTAKHTVNINIDGRGLGPIDTLCVVCKTLNTFQISTNLCIVS